MNTCWQPHYKSDKHLLKYYVVTLQEREAFSLFFTPFGVLFPFPVSHLIV